MGRGKRRFETVLFEGESSNVAEVPGQETDLLKTKRGNTVLQEAHELPANRRIPLVLNEWDQPVGDNAKLLAIWIGVIVRANCPLNYASWHKVPSGTKTHLKNLIHKKFALPDAITVWMKKTMSNRFRDAKCELKASYFYDSDSEDVNLENCPSDIQPHQWHYLVSYWRSSEGKIVEERNKKSRSLQVSSQSSGSKSFARIEHELSIDAGKKVGKIKVLEVTHKRKNGTFIDESVSNVLEKAKATIEELPEEPSYMKELEILTETMGAGKNGIVRGTGTGPSPTTVFKHSVYMEPTRTEEYSSLKKEVAEQHALIREQQQTLERQGNIIKGQGDVIKGLGDKISLFMNHLMGTSH